MWISALAGVAAWTFAEYALHHWYGHLGRGRNQFSRDHLQHHAKYMFFAATRKKIAAAAAAMAVVAPIAIAAAGVADGAAFTIAFVGTYALYEVLHRRAHTHRPIGPYGRWLRKHHFYHHFGSAKVNNGVTSPIWDIVFRTYRRPGVVPIPRKMAMPWLVDPRSGAVRPQYARDYRLVGRA